MLTLSPRDPISLSLSPFITFIASSRASHHTNNRMADPTSTIPIEGDDTEVVDEGNRSILMGIISQLSKGGDLHRVTLPTFVLEPRSMLERITDFMSHPDIIIKYACLGFYFLSSHLDDFFLTLPTSPFLHRANQLDDPVERFVAVTRYFLSGWHIKPKVGCLLVSHQISRKKDAAYNLSFSA